MPRISRNTDLMDYQNLGWIHVLELDETVRVISERMAHNEMTLDSLFKNFRVNYFRLM